MLTIAVEIDGKIINCENQFRIKHDAHFFPGDFEDILLLSLKIPSILAFHTGIRLNPKIG